MKHSSNMATLGRWSFSRRVISALSSRPRGASRPASCFFHMHAACRRSHQDHTCAIWSGRCCGSMASRLCRRGPRQIRRRLPKVPPRPLRNLQKPRNFCFATLRKVCMASAHALETSMCRFRALCGEMGQPRSRASQMAEGSIVYDGCIEQNINRHKKHDIQLQQLRFLM